MGWLAFNALREAGVMSDCMKNMQVTRRLQLIIG